MDEEDTSTDVFFDNITASGCDGIEAIFIDCEWIQSSVDRELFWGKEAKKSTEKIQCSSNRERPLKSDRSGV